MPDWLEDASANRHIKTYVKDFLDVSGNMYVRSSSEEYNWNTYGQVLSGNYESDGAVYFGIATHMDASGTTIVVGANADNTTASQNGAVYVYRYDTTAEIWYQLGNTLGSPTTAADTSSFGRFVQISANGNRIAVLNESQEDLYFYDYNSGSNTWVSAGSILDGEHGINVRTDPGFHLSGDGNTILFSDMLDNGNTGKVLVYRNNTGTTWTKIGEFTGGSLDMRAGGIAISYNGNRICIGETNYDYDSTGAALNNAGRAAIYDYTGTPLSWTQVGDWIYSDIEDDHFGASGNMTGDGSIVAIHSYGLAEGIGSLSAYQYDANVDGSWNQLGSTITGIGDYTWGRGSKISDDGTTLVAGHQYYDGTHTDQGALYVYKYINGDWEQQGDTIVATWNLDADRLGYFYSYAINDDGTKIVGGGLHADLNTTFSGAVQAWQWSAKSYGPLIDISGETVIFGKDMHKDDPNYYKVVQDGMDATVYGQTNELYGLDGTDFFGAAIAMNADGTRMIVGSPLADVETTRVGIGIVYHWQNERWGQMGQNISPTTDYESFSASTVDMNDAGDKVVIGSQENLTVPGGASGLLTSYEFINGDWVQRGSALTSSNSSGRFGGEGCAMDGTGNIIAGMDVVGSVKVYQYVEGNSDWSQLGSDISISTGQVNNGFAATKRIDLNQDGTIIVIGDVFDDTTGTNNGRLSVYKFTGDVTDGSWNLIGNHITITTSSSFPQNDDFGREVSINSDGTIVGGTSIFYNSEEGRTFIYKYSEDAGDWVQLGTDIGKDQMPDDDPAYNARSIGLSGDGKTVTIGHSHDDTNGTNAGSVSVFKYANGNWVRIGTIYGSQSNGYLRYSCISRDGKRIAGGGIDDDSNGSNAGIVITASIINYLDGAAMKIEHDRVHIPKLEAGNGWTTATNLFEGKLSMPMMTLTGLSSYERDYRKEWGLEANTEGFNRDRWAFTHDTGHKHASYLYLDDSGQTGLDLLLRGFERVNETYNYFRRTGYALISRYKGSAMFFQTSSTEENQSIPNKKFSLGIGVPPGWYVLNVVGNAITNSGWDGSDDRLKHNEIVITNGLEAIRKLAPRHYYKTRKIYDADHNFDLDASGNPLDASGNLLPTTEYSIETGFIAQEVKEISELAHTFQEGEFDQPHGIHYSSIFVWAIKALQELDEKVQQRQAIINSLEEKIQLLESA